MNNEDQDWIKDNMNDTATDTGDFEGEVYFSTDGKNTVHVKANTREGTQAGLRRIINMNNEDQDWIKDNMNDTATDTGDFEGEVYFSTDGKNTVHVKANTREGRRAALIWGNEVYKRLIDTYGTKQGQAVKEYAKEAVEDLGKCSKCDAPNKKSLKSGKLYCSALCWKNE